MIRFGFLSTYAPTVCGLASFTASLRAALPAGSQSTVVRAVETARAPGEPLPAGVAGELVAGSADSCRAAAALLDHEDVVIVQHEYGIYGGPDGDDVLHVLGLLTVPVIVVLHTVLTQPTEHQREVLDAVLATAAAVVVMSDTARSRLAAGYALPAGPVLVIPHGAPDAGATTRPLARLHRHVITWGLIGPGKGIEWGIDAMALLPRQWPSPRYLVAGRTHPKVLAAHGERYRDGLRARADALGLDRAVRFDARYLDAATLSRLVARAEVVLLPYDSREQVTSGVLIEAVTAGIPVVATRFPHAVELLSGGAGILVDHQDPTAIAEAIQSVLGSRPTATAMVAAAAVAARPLAWSSVAERYRALAETLADRLARAPRPAAGVA